MRTYVLYCTKYGQHLCVCGDLSVGDTLKKKLEVYNEKSYLQCKNLDHEGEPVAF